MTSSHKRQVLYAHCYLQRKDAEGAIHHTIGFIPAKFAIPGKVLTLTFEGKKQPGWEVMSVGKELFPENLLVHQSQDYKRMRKASDI